MRALYFWAGYCGFCKWARREIIEPLIEQGAAIELVDCMSCVSIAEKYKIRKVPTLVFVDDEGREISRLHRHEITTDAIKDALE